jgi:hypothetical protein
LWEKLPHVRAVTWLGLLPAAVSRPDQERLGPTAVVSGVTRESPFDRFDVATLKYLASTRRHSENSRLDRLLGLPTRLKTAQQKWATFGSLKPASRRVEGSSTKTTAAQGAQARQQRACVEVARRETKLRRRIPRCIRVIEGRQTYAG